MTKTITLHSCHILIGVWILISGLSVLPINYHFGIYNSLDDQGCRISYHVDRVICPDPSGRLAEDGNPLAVFKDTGKRTSDYAGMWPEDIVKNFALLSLLPFIIIQIIAFFSWNSHYHWLSLEVKSCWPDKDQNTEQGKCQP